MDNSLIIGGKEIEKAPFTGKSQFYPGYHFTTSGAGALEVALAIGNARAAEHCSPAEGRECLKRAAGLFTYTQESLEHTVVLTGMPIRLVEDLYRQIPHILGELPGGLEKRFKSFGPGGIGLLEDLGAGRYKVLRRRAGFCYAVTPGSDPRAAALVAANLVALGIPFVLRASSRDAAASLTLKALLEAGLDPAFCSLIYLDPADPESNKLHFKLVDSATILWTFGAEAVIDPTLRYESHGPSNSLNLDGLEIDPTDPASLPAALSQISTHSLEQRLLQTEELQDHFTGKTILRHTAGNCAAILYESLSAPLQPALYTSLGYPIVCTALRTMMAVEADRLPGQLAEYLAALKCGDPLDPETQVGYINPRYLDQVEQLVQAYDSRLTFFGGQRLSPIQSTPLFVVGGGPAPEFFEKEIPAYVLAVRPCNSMPEAIERLNAFCSEPRLAVTLLGIPPEQRLEAVLDLNTHAVLVDQSTFTFTPLLHEGNDYCLALTQGSLLTTQAKQRTM